MSRSNLIDQWKASPVRRPERHILIANRGNISGRQPEKENTPAYVQAALKAGYHACVDVIYHHGAFCLIAADRLITTPPSFFVNPKIWSRAYDAMTLDALCGLGAHSLPNLIDGFTFTSAQFIWTLPGQPLSPRSIAVCPEEAPPNWFADCDIAGLCSNVVAEYVHAA